MALLPNSPTNLYITFGLNNIVARETRVEIKPKSSADDLASRSNSPSDRLKNHVWPALKKGISSSLAEGTKIARKIHDSPSSNTPVLPSVSFQPMQFKPAESQSFSAKRDINLAELGMMPMTAVQGPRMDSPTIPGRNPVHGRSISAPETTANRTPFERSIQEPISEPLILFSQVEVQVQEAPAKNEELRDTSRSASATGFVSPSDNKEGILPQKSFIMDIDEEEDKPPAVPPKSPRLANRVMMALPNISETHLVTPKSSDSSLRPRAATAMEIRPRRHIAELHRRNESTPAATVCSAKAQQVKAKPRGTKQKHEAGETLMQCHERSKRRRSLLGNRLSKQFVLKEKTTKYAQLPTGYNLPEAKSQLSSSDVEKLRKQARDQAEKFRVLQYHEVKNLSKELRFLDARCDYLRSTSKALRAGRNHLHERVIAHLRSSRSVTNSRENILGQEETLVQLDKSIDEWITKLEQADNRRTRVRQMLLEHIAASLILSGAYDGQDGNKEATPAIQNDANNNDVDDDEDDVYRESIKIYADCGVYGDADVADLLAEIERQMETMNGPQRPPSMSNFSMVV